MIENRQFVFDKMKYAIHTKFKGAKLNERNGRFYITQNGKNIISSEWPDLQVSESIFDAYKNAFTLEHWSRQSIKRIDTVKATISNVCGNTDSLPSVELYEYAINDTSIIDEELMGE